MGAIGIGSSGCVLDGPKDRALTRGNRRAARTRGSSTARWCTPSTLSATSSLPSSPSRAECWTPPAERVTGQISSPLRARLRRSESTLTRATIEHARLRYPAAEFVQGDIQRLPFEDGAFDLVVSFETIEHVPDPERVLDELRRVLVDEGVLVISTPNKDQYLVENEFHEREFRHQEFVELLHERFASVELLLQRNWLASTIVPPELARDASGRAAEGITLREAHRNRARGRAVYGGPLREYAGTPRTPSGGRGGARRISGARAADRGHRAQRRPGGTTSI